MSHTWSVILAGGAGTRFWPLSRRARPKQLLDLFGQGPMVRTTAERIRPLVPSERQLIVTGEQLGGAIRELLPELPAANVLEEPVGRNTAAAIAWAAIEARRRDPEAVLMVLPADHYIAEVEAYRDTCRLALEAAAARRIVTLGIRPTRPETGYGYICRGAELRDGVYRVAAFKEKPDLDRAMGYLRDGRYWWNAGMFFVTAGLILDELERYEPGLVAALAPLDSEAVEPEQVAEVYQGLKSISIDFAVMERSTRVAVVPGEFGWSDVGSWASLWDFREPGRDSFARPAGDVIEIDGRGNVLYAEQGVIATVGIRDTVVVRTADTTLVCPRGSAQRLREIVDELSASDKQDLL